MNCNIDIPIPCNHKPSNVYGGYCKKHRSHHLCKDRLLVMERFTGDMKDYTVPQLKFFYDQVMKPNGERKKPYQRKETLFKSVNTYIYEHKYSHLPVNHIIKIQSVVRKRILQKKINRHGLASINRSICKNDEDFYTYDPKEEIENIYFFSYRDTSHNYWCFDIRSIKKLLDMNYGNPYTMEPISNEVKEQVNACIEALQKDHIGVSVDKQVIVSRKSAMKQSFVDIFAQIEYAGYSCDVEWILSLNNSKLKKLYRELEDIWNYRANLSIEIKRKIVPPLGRLCVIPMQDYLSCNVKLELQEMLANELKKILLAQTPGDMNLGFMYFIIALSLVHDGCLAIHPWVHSVL